ncbi:MAG: hypothetical protein F4027_17400 [Rhodospirillaceae bacterium]|nr:hypothetical protein [Rhodospirillaceae bacterium]MYK60289.1 hypothetical protein [Rhodospirillaceae bacterium]
MAAFLKGRLEEPETVDWALRLKPDRRVERAAIRELLVGPDAPRLREPYATAWPLILESWSYHATAGFPASALLQIRRRLQGGDRSGNLVEEIADFAAPRLAVKPLRVRPQSPARKSGRPRKLDDLLSAGLTSVSLAIGFRDHRIDIGLEEITDADFLHAVACALMSAVDRGLYLARRIHGSSERDWPPLVSPLRVYFVPPKTAVNDRGGSGDRLFEPDALTPGLGPAVKLLHAVLQRIAELDAGTARSLLGRWRHSDIAVYRRLWAAAARNADTVSAAEAGEFVTGLDDAEFWDFWPFPEFAELRATRFRDFEPEMQALILRRLRKGLPRRYIPRNMDAEEIQTKRRALAAMELRRIEIGSGTLPVQDRDWLLEATDEFPGLSEMAIDGYFRDPWVLPRFPPSTTPESRFDNLEGETRLRALEDALSSETSAHQATNWLRQSDRAVHILGDLEGAASLVNRFPRLWDRFGHAHSHPRLQSESETPRDAESEAVRVLGLMNRLSDATVETAIDGISHWLYMWSDHIIGSELGRQVWLRVWPTAVKVTNAAEAGEDQGFADAGVRADDEQRARREMDAFHLPVGKLLRVFLAVFSFSEDFRDPFASGSLLTQMRDRAMDAPGRSGLIARCQFTQKLPDFLRIDPAWAMQRLVDPLLSDDDRSVPLWSAVASAWIDSELLKIIGEAAANRVLDDRLGTETRKGLVSCLVHEGLAAFAERREPSISHARISQVLRTADNEIRQGAAFAIWHTQDYAHKKGRGSLPPRTTFLSTVKPFLEQVWPQERTLATSDVSHHFACLPAVSGEAFAEAVDEVARFLVPFDCWSLLDCGFNEGGLPEDFGMPGLSDVIDDAPKAQALLRLLDLTVGDSQDAVIPDDLSTALDRIETKAPRLTSDPAFRRLAAAARR